MSWVLCIYYMYQLSTSHLCASFILLLDLRALSKVALSSVPRCAPPTCTNSSYYSPFGCTACIQYKSSLHTVHTLSVCLTSSLRSNINLLIICVFATFIPTIINIYKNFRDITIIFCGQATQELWAKPIWAKSEFSCLAMTWEALQVAGTN